MSGFGKVAGVGLASIFALLLAMSTAGVALALVIPGPIHVSIPEAHLSGVTMYGGVYSGPTAPLAPVVVQEVDSLGCPLGQTVTRTLSVAGVTIEATIDMGTADLTDVLMKASSVGSSSGTLTGVTMEAMPEPEGIEQTIVSGVMYDLESDIFFVSMASLVYTNLSVGIEIV